MRRDYEELLVENDAEAAALDGRLFCLGLEMSGPMPYFQAVSKMRAIAFLQAERLDRRAKILAMVEVE